MEALTFFFTLWTRTGNTDSASSWTKRLNMRFTSRQRLPCQQLIAKCVHKAKLKCPNLYWELRTLSYFSVYITTKQAPTADFCFHTYLTFFFIHSAATSARSSENVFILHSFFLKNVLNISLFHDLTLIFKENLILWDS